MVVNLTGPHGVGKTTLAHGTSIKHPDIRLIEEFKYRDTGFDVTTKEGFCKNELVYCEEKAELYHNALHYDGITLFVRGIEDLKFYITHYPEDNGYEWMIDDEFDLLKQYYEKYKSDLIVFLDADIQTLMYRCQNDSRKNRILFDGWHDRYLKHKDFILGLEGSILLDTSYKTQKEVLASFEEILFNY